jgi:hypothetical protein
MIDRRTEEREAAISGVGQFSQSRQIFEGAPATSEAAGDDVAAFALKTLVRLSEFRQ